MQNFDVKSEADDIFDSLMDYTMTTYVVVGKPETGKTELLKNLAKIMSDKGIGYKTVDLEYNNFEGFNQISSNKELFDFHNELIIMINQKSDTPYVLVDNYTEMDINSKFLIHNLIKNGIKIFVVGYHTDDFPCDVFISGDSVENAEHNAIIVDTNPYDPIVKDWHILNTDQHRNVSI